MAVGITNTQSGSEAIDISNKTSTIGNGHFIERHSYENSKSNTGINNGETIHSILGKIDGYINSFWPIDIGYSSLRISNRQWELSEKTYYTNQIFIDLEKNPLTRITYQVNEPGTVSGINTYYCVLAPRPASSNKPGDTRIDLGAAAQYAWSNISVQKAPVVTSDKKLKDNIEDVSYDFAKEFVMGIKPKKYKLKTGDRIHYGLIAQDVEELIFSLGLTREDFGGLCVNNLKDLALVSGKEEKQKIEDVEDEETYSLRYEEFLSPLFRFVQMQQEQIEELKQEIERIKEQINF